MRHSKLIKALELGGILTVFVLGGVMTAFAEDAPAHGFVGVKKCKTCHKKEAKGNQYGAWLESSHSKAYETLATEEAMVVAKERGIENPQTDDACLKCHVTAYPVMGNLENEKITLEEGISCESCHGAGADYYKKKTMKAITAGTTDGASVGLMTPDESVCTKCHNDESPGFEGFDFDEMLKKIAHPMPEQAEG